MRTSAIIAGLVLAACSVGAVQAQDTTISYQGSLNESGGLADGQFDMVFTLWDAASGGAQLGTVSINNVDVAGGLFMVGLDFGAEAFDATPRWLEITVDGNVLSPRQPVSRSPYSIQTRGIQVDENEHVGIGVIPGSARLRVWNLEGAGFESYTTTGRPVEAVTTEADMAILGSNQDPDGIGVFGQHQQTGNWGYLGSPQYGVLGRATDTDNDWAGYFEGRGYFSNRLFVGRQTDITSNEWFGVHAFGGSNQYVGMYVSADVNESWPFYGYSTDGNADVWHYYDGGEDTWNLNHGGTRLTVTANGWVGLSESSPDHPLDMASGAHCTSGGTWTNASSRTLKQGFEPVDARAILDKVAALPLTTWTYNAEAEAGTRHLGPVAEDFAEAFGLGETDQAITTVDANGVALAAIQGLNDIVEQKDREIGALESEVEELGSRIEELEALVRALAERE